MSTQTHLFQSEQQEEQPTMKNHVNTVIVSVTIKINKQYTNYVTLFLCITDLIFEIGMQNIDNDLIMS